MSLPDGFPARSGPRPSTTDVNPHTQLDQNAPAGLQDQLRDHALSLPGVRAGASNVSVPGAVAVFLDHPPLIFIKHHNHSDAQQHLRQRIEEVAHPPKDVQQRSPELFG